MSIADSALSLVASAPLFLAAGGLTAILALEAATRLTQLRFVFAGLIYLTTALWYFVDPVYNAADYQKFSPAELEEAYLQVVLFLIGFRFLVQVVPPRTPTRVLREFDPRKVERGPIIGALVFAWLVLFATGMALANFDFVNTLFPIRGRATWSTLFARGRYAGTTGFLLSAASYSYMMLCAGFGVIMVCSRRSTIRACMLGMMAFTWPMFALSGSRHTFLAVCLPSILATLLVKRWSRMQRTMFLIGCGTAINLLMLAVIEFRNEGFDKLFTGAESAQRVAEAKHRGLNMPEELMYILRYQRSGALPIENGKNYVEHALNFIPRPLWPDKPLVGRQFAVLRVGLTRGDVTATISYGFIGQGVANFGPYLGPFAPALLLTLLCRFLCRLRDRGDPFARSALILFCLGLIPNLGRDISLLVLWPMLFGYAAVRIYERYLAPRPSLARFPVRRPRSTDLSLPVSEPASSRSAVARGVSPSSAIVIPHTP